MTEQDWTVQVSAKLGGHMVNVRGVDGESFSENWILFMEKHQEIVKDLALLEGAYNLERPGGAPAPAQAASGGTPEIKDDPGMPPGMTRPNCADCQAPMRWSQFNSRAGKLTKMWKCSADDKHPVAWPERR